ncbi:hypothetical protein B0H11DRAFT_1933218 [Mycena galericulata]|nr:hypothetical protein B0H11DRAFT_1933218 [Mycena galericulata]
MFWDFANLIHYGVVHPSLCLCLKRYFWFLVYVPLNDVFVRDVWYCVAFNGAVIFWDHIYPAVLTFGDVHLDWIFSIFLCCPRIFFRTLILHFKHINCAFFYGLHFQFPFLPLTPFERLSVFLAFWILRFQWDKLGITHHANKFPEVCDFLFFDRTFCTAIVFHAPCFLDFGRLVLAYFYFKWFIQFLLRFNYHLCIFVVLHAFIYSSVLVFDRNLVVPFVLYGVFILGVVRFKRLCVVIRCILDGQPHVLPSSIVF